MDKIEIPYIDISKVLGEFSLPGIDLKALIEARQRDLDALTKANRLAVDGMRAVADKQAELLQAVIGELGSKIKELTANGVPSAKTTELARQTIEKGIAAMRDVAEAAAQPQSAAVEVISTRVSESIAEIRQLLERK
jgi:phasin family protein